MANENKPIKKSEPDREAIRRSKEEKARRSRRRLRQAVGVAMSVLMVVGVVSIVQFAIETVQTSSVVDTSETEYYEQLLMPMVWFDQLPFESLEQADPNAIKQEIIWGVLNELDEAVEYNDLGQPLVPAAEMDLYAAELFGTEYKLVHESFDDPVQQLSYEYDPQTNMYAATATGLNAQYVGTVVEVEELSGGILRVTMGYVSNFGSNNELITTPDFDNPSKYMDYFFRRDGNEYYLYALRPNTQFVPDEPAEEEVQETQAQEEMTAEVMLTSSMVIEGDSVAQDETDTSVVSDTSIVEDASNADSE